MIARDVELLLEETRDTKAGAMRTLRGMTHPDDILLSHSRSSMRRVSHPPDATARDF